MTKNSFGLYSGMYSKGYRHCFNCNCEIKEIGNNKNMPYADGKKHFTCGACVAKMEAPVTETTQEAEASAEPFQAHDVVKFIPVYAQEFVSNGKTHALVLNCINYGTTEKPNWAVDVQFLKEIGYESLQLTPVRAYMVAAWQVEKINRSWVR